MLQWRVATAIPLFTVLIVKHRMTMREGATATVFARQTNAHAFVDERRIGQVFSHAPVKPLLAFTHCLTVVDHFFNARMQDETFGHRGELFCEGLDGCERHCGVSSIGPSAAHKFRPILLERSNVIRENRFVGVRTFVHRVAKRRDVLIAFTGFDHALCFELICVELASAWMLMNFLVHQRLRDHRFVLLVVPEATETDKINEHVFVENRAIVHRDFSD